jgi:hypothetical protein
MFLNTTMILNLLVERPGHYIQHDMGRYRIKKANGVDVTIRENGQDLPVEPTAAQMDDLAVFDRAVVKLMVLKIWELKDHPDLPQVLEQHRIQLVED